MLSLARLAAATPVASALKAEFVGQCSTGVSQRERQTDRKCTPIHTLIHPLTLTHIHALAKRLGCNTYTWACDGKRCVASHNTDFDAGAMPHQDSQCFFPPLSYTHMSKNQRTGRPRKQPSYRTVCTHSLPCKRTRANNRLHTPAA